MKKSFLLLPITVAILTACSSDAPAPVENADGTLSPGIMQPVDNPSMGGNTSWEPQIQQSSVPNSMNGPIPQTPAQPAQAAPQPNFQPINRSRHQNHNRRRRCKINRSKLHKILRFRAIRKPMRRITAKSIKVSTKVKLTLCVKAIPCSLSRTFPVWM